MLLSEAKQILKDNGYIVERSEHPSDTYFDWLMSGGFTMSLFRGGKPTKTFFILMDLCQNGEMSGVDLRKKYFNGNTDNMKTWAANNSKYISTRKIGARRYFNVTDAGYEAFKAAMPSDKQ